MRYIITLVLSSNPPVNSHFIKPTLQWLAGSAPTSSPSSLNLSPMLVHLGTQFQPLASLYVLKQIKTSGLRPFELAVPFAGNLFPPRIDTAHSLTPFTQLHSVCQRGLPDHSTKEQRSCPVLPTSLLRFTFLLVLVDFDMLCIYLCIFSLFHETGLKEGRTLFCSLLYPQCTQQCMGINPY